MASVGRSGRPLRAHTRSSIHRHSEPRGRSPGSFFLVNHAVRTTRSVFTVMIAIMLVFVIAVLSVSSPVESVKPQHPIVERLGHQQVPSTVYCYPMGLAQAFRAHSTCIASTGSEARLAEHGIRGLIVGVHLLEQQHAIIEAVGHVESTRASDGHGSRLAKSPSVDGCCPKAASCYAVRYEVRCSKNEVGWLPVRMRVGEAKYAVVEFVSHVEETTLIDRHASGLAQTCGCNCAASSGKGGLTEDQIRRLAILVGPHKSQDAVIARVSDPDNSLPVSRQSPGKTEAARANRRSGARAASWCVAGEVHLAEHEIGGLTISPRPMKGQNSMVVAVRHIQDPSRANG
jgi:hypothetical protein